MLKINASSSKPNSFLIAHPKDIVEKENNITVEKDTGFKIGVILKPVPTKLNVNHLSSNKNVNGSYTKKKAKKAKKANAF